MPKKQQIVLLIDSAEKQNVKTTFQTHLEKEEHYIVHLSIGDYWFCIKGDEEIDDSELKKFNNNNNKLSTKDCIAALHLTPVFIIERKIWTDYGSSIRSRHLHEQRGRLMDSGINSMILIEGLRPKKLPYTNQDVDTLDYFAFNSMLRKDGVAYYYTRNLQHTIQVVKHAIQKFQDPQFIEKKNGGKTFVDCMKMEKKSQLTNKQYYIAVLTQIPGISSQVARQISSCYKTLPLLILNSIKNKKKVIACLSQLKHTTDGKRFGEKRSLVVIQYILGLNKMY